MTDLSITAANVVAGAGAKSKSGHAGVAVTAGQPGYLDPATDTWKLADSNSATAEAREPDGIFLNSAAAGQPVRVHTRGDLTIGATLTPGMAYYLSDTPGGICLYADLASGEYPVFIGIARSASVLNVHIVPSGVAL